MTKKIDSILKEVLERVEPLKEEMDIIEENLEKFLAKIKKRKKTLRIDADIFVGGSFAKKTAIKKDAYDVDIFVRFDKKYEEKRISELTKKLLAGVKAVSVVHGSRDYFRVKINSYFFIEVVPVMKIKNTDEARNITDLSYSHVKYMNKKVKNKKILEGIKIAKSFCHANNCYGAESYINGFSGYGLELLVYYYKNFLKFVKAISKIKGREVVDIEKHYRNKSAVLMDLNSSKLQSPIILIDPTHKQRNALAALSQETFKKFQRVCRDFLKNPSIKYFEIQKTDLEKIKKEAGKKNQKFILLEAETNKQEGDVAGSKLLKFYRHLETEISKFFGIKKKGFNYNHQQSARYFFVVKSKKEILAEGPNIEDKKNVLAFRKKHKKVFVKKKRIYARKKIDFSLNEFIEKWKKKNKKQIEEMSIRSLEIH